MKHLILSTLLLFAACLPASAQVEIDTKALLGTWTTKKDMALVEMTYAKHGKMESRIEVNASQLQGSIIIKSSGTWRAESDSIVQVIDPNSISVKYNGSNNAIGAQIESMVSANKEKMFGQFGAGKGEIVLRNVVVADNLLIFSQKFPSLDGSLKEEKVVMRKEE